MTGVSAGGQQRCGFKYAGLYLFDLNQVGMLRITLGQRRRPVGGQGIHTGTMVDTVTAHIGLMPGSLPHRDNARHDPRRHFGFDTHFATPIKYPHLVAADNAARLGVQWVDPHLLTTSRLQHIDVAVGRVGTGLVMEPNICNG